MSALDVGGAQGSSPHTRGARQAILVDSDFFGIIPAYAGSTFYHIPSVSPPLDHPRIRGEHVPAEEPCC